MQRAGAQAAHLAESALHHNPFGFTTAHFAPQLPPQQQPEQQPEGGALIARADPLGMNDPEREAWAFDGQRDRDRDRDRDTISGTN